MASVELPRRSWRSRHHDGRLTPNVAGLSGRIGRGGRSVAPDSTRITGWTVWTACLVFAMTAGAASAADDLVIADFEGETYGEWKVSGEAFGPGPAKGTLAGQMVVDGFRGRGLVNSFLRGDGTTGRLASPEFRIERKFLAFLVGGGKDPEKLAIRLIVDGKVVRSATGPNDRPGGSETLAQESWDVAEFAGKQATIEIVDDARGSWGHINVDQIVQTDRKPPGLVTNAERVFDVTEKYLHLPIRNGATKRVVSVVIDGRVQVRNDIELADGEADWWAPLDVSEWKGQKVTLRVDKLSEDSRALSSITTSGELREAESLYREPLRGQFHFSPRRGWNNDPNGLVFYKGEYHLFFQHNPYGWGWGNMHWGHAVSKDLIRWEELGETLVPDEMGPMFSGSAVVDWRNTSGLGTAENPPLILLYTAAGNPTVQCLAWSVDGRTFTKFSGNPILRQITPGNRDPKVIWHGPTSRWVMTLYVEVDKKHVIQFFGSKDLKEWTYLSSTEGFFECPDFFELPVEGQTAKSRWVLTGASSEYMVGTFDGTSFVPETPKLPGHRGRGFYAAQTFSDIPASDGRRIQIGWFQTETKGMPFNQSMTIPLEMRLIQTAEGQRVTWAPARELNSLREESRRLNPFTLPVSAPRELFSARGDLLEIDAEFEPGESTAVVFSVRGMTFRWDAKASEVVVNGHKAATRASRGRQTFRLFVDRTGVELFMAGGQTYVPLPVQPASDNHTITVEAQGGAVKFTRLDVHDLRSAWERNQ